MLAAVLHAFGPPERLVAEELPVPRAGPGQLLVDVQIASVTFVETQIRAGTRDGWTEEAGPADVVFDGVGGEIGAAAFALLRPGGRFVAYGMASGSFAPELDGERAGVTIVRGVALTPERMRALSERALAEAAAGRLVATVGQTFALDRAAAAHAAIESRATIGKTLLLA